MLNKKVFDALNIQMQEEFYSAYLYLAMAAFASVANFKGFANWMRLQSEEEWGHAIKIYDYILERGGEVKLQEIKKPAYTFKSIRNMMDVTLKHEQRITERIHNLYDLAHKEKDHATSIMLQWFVNEQVEEEASVRDIVERMKMIPDSATALLYLDKELKKRGTEK